MNNMKKAAGRTLLSCFLLAGVVTHGVADQSNQGQMTAPDLTTIALEDLLNIEIVSASKKEQKISKTAAAIYVITAEDIRRSVARTIPDLLRMVPGVNVAQISTNKWAVSIRGFNDRFANKLLVMIDGRSVYTPMFSGVFWEVEDTLLEDIERIEVIRGPGGTLWGANAVNGVINIITKHSKNTQGGMVTAGGGSLEHGFGTIRYGGKLGQDAYYRVFSKYHNRPHSVHASGREAFDQWDAVRGGFRMDWNLSERDIFTWHGDLYQSRSGERVRAVNLSPPSSFRTNQFAQGSGGNLIGRWDHTFAGRSEMTLQLYYVRAIRDNGLHAETRDAYDFDLQHHLSFGKRQDIVWGLGYSYNADTTRVQIPISTFFDPRDGQVNVLSTFFQDEISLSEGVRLTIGSKFERNNYSGFEVQPGVKLLWTPRHQHTFWGAISRAVRTPARNDRDNRQYTSARLDGAGVINVGATIGNPFFKSETVVAHELGYRVQPRKALSLDVATFYNFYQNLKTSEPAPSYFESTPIPHKVNPRIYGNELKGESYGLEFATSWNVSDFWKVSTSYAWLRVRLRVGPTSMNGRAEATAGNDPKHQFNIRSYLKLPYTLEFDNTLYYVDALVNQLTPRYFKLDSRVGWHPARAVSFSVGAQNLLQPTHPEFDSSNPILIRRGVYGKIIWGF